MSKLSRRSFISASLAAMLAVKPPLLYGKSKPHVVIIGGGAGGATAARMLASQSQGAVSVTLVEMNKQYKTCFFSNLYLGGVRTYQSLVHDYHKLHSNDGIELIHSRALGVDAEAKTVTLEDGVLHYDKLILSPGIDFVEGSVQGWGLFAQDKMPHAFKGGEQVKLLKSQIEAMPKGGVFGLVAPPNPSRCPPGPYERVSMVAHLLKQINPTAKIIIADPKPVFAKMGLFREAWKKYYKGMIDWNSDVSMDDFSVDPEAMTMSLEGESIKLDVCNVIPAQKAGAIAEIAGVTENGWAPVYSADMRSRLNKHIYILGDAAAQGDMPKSGFSANSQAKVCASGILAELSGAAPSPATYSNICWSLLSAEDGVKIGATYKATEEKIAKVDGFVSQRKEDAALRKANFEESLAWYQGITKDMFG